MKHNDTFTTKGAIFTREGYTLTGWSTSQNSVSGEFQELLNKVKATNSELKTYWEGSDASKYSTSVEQQAEYMQQLTDTINEIGGFLVKVGQAYQEACENNANAING